LLRGLLPLVVVVWVVAFVLEDVAGDEALTIGVGLIEPVAGCVRTGVGWVVRIVACVDPVRCVLGGAAYVSMS
jgi:hypothetical protein